MLLVVAGERANAMGAQELVFVEHARQNPAQPVRVHQGGNAAVGVSQMGLGPVG